MDVNNFKTLFIGRSVFKKFIVLNFLYSVVNFKCYKRSLVYQMFHWSSYYDCRYMSIDTQNMPNNEISGGQEEYEDRVVTDSVHERFRQTHVRCDDCKQDILGNEVAIRKHFNDSHPSDRHCCYCKGKVFMYRQIMTVDGRESPASIVYHKCQHKQLETAWCIERIYINANISIISRIDFLQ